MSNVCNLVTFHGTELVYDGILILALIIPISLGSRILYLQQIARVLGNHHIIAGIVSFPR